MREPTILEAAAVPRLRCSTCGAELLGQGWLEHHDDGSHTFTPAALTPLAPEVPPPGEPEPAEIAAMVRAQVRRRSPR